VINPAYAAHGNSRTREDARAEAGLLLCTPRLSDQSYYIFHYASKRATHEMHTDAFFGTRLQKHQHRTMFRTYNGNSTRA
jgi:hypothetical protein